MDKRIFKAIILTYEDKDGNERTVFALSEDEFAKKARAYGKNPENKVVSMEKIYIAGGQAVEGESDEISKIFLLGYKNEKEGLHTVFALSEEEYGKQAREYGAAGNEIVSSSKINRM